MCTKLHTWRIGDSILKSIYAQCQAYSFMAPNFRDLKYHNQIFNDLFVFPLVYYLLCLMIAWYERAQGDYISRNVKNKFPKLHICNLACFVLRDFGTMGSGYHVYILTKAKHKTWHTVHFPYNPINFATFHFWHCPQFTHPTHSPVIQS